jgi:GH15 family glucan-1,4-alpha-glucosidase
MVVQPIENHGVIGDLHTAALVGMDGSIDFMCFPRFDSPSLFAALLDPVKGGHFQIAPVHADGFRRKQLYFPDTNMLLTRFLANDGVAEISDFMPIKDLGHRHDLVRRVKVVRGEILLLTSRPCGSIVAAPTFGLPEEIGGKRNWDYRFTWVRDASFTLYALMRLAGTQDGLPGREGTFSMCSFWYVECLARAGDLKQARSFSRKPWGMPITWAFMPRNWGSAANIWGTSRRPSRTWRSSARPGTWIGGSRRCMRTDGHEARGRHLLCVAAGILPAVEGGILPPGAALRASGVTVIQSAIPPGRMPGSTAGKMPAATE